ncbi:MAG: carboxypeptidase-like regulatory domain-containing protein, partial [Planctomycetota bacterium]
TRRPNPMVCKLLSAKSNSSNENNDFELRRLGRLIGTVVNDAGEPLTTFSVAPKIHENGRTLQRQPARTFNSPNGEFEYPGINPGDYDIVVGCPGFAAATVANIRVEENIDTDLGQIRLSEGGKVGGFIIDGATGQPIVGATITVKGGSAAILSNPFGSNRAGNRPRRGGVVGRQRSDKEGYFMISGLAQDVVTLDIEQRNYMPQSIEMQAGVLDAQITLSRGGLIEGRVITTDKSGGGGVQLFLTGNGRSDRQVTDRKGSFTFGGLVDGNYEVRVSNFGLVGSGKSSMRDAPVYKVSVRNGVAPFLEITYDGPTGRRDEN